jgi:hypothetical protein
MRKPLDPESFLSMASANRSSTTALTATQHHFINVNPAITERKEYYEEKN